MNKEQSKVLIEAIKKMINTEVSKQLSTMKVEITRQILSEIRKQQKSSSVQSLYSAPSVQAKNRQQKIYSNNPLLNEVLAQTQMNMKLLEGQHEEIIDESGRILNISTTGPEGQHIDLQKPAVQAVLEAMNRDYSDVVSVEPKQPTSRPIVEKSKPTKPTLNGTNYVKSMMEISDDDLNNGTVNFPDPFSETEW